MIRGVGPYELTLDGWSNVVLWLKCISLRWVQMMIGGVWASSHISAPIGQRRIERDPNNSLSLSYSATHTTNVL